jgi:hypothetical protein
MTADLDPDEAKLARPEAKELRDALQARNAGTSYHLASNPHGTQQPGHAMLDRFPATDRGRAVAAARA